MRLALAVLFVLHGIAHLPGFAVAWRLTTTPELPYKTTLLGGRVDLGDVGIRVMGLLWLAAGLGFVAAGVATWRGTTTWPMLALVVALVSLGLCVAAWPDSRIGVVVNFAILVLLLVGGRLGWFSTGR